MRRRCAARRDLGERPRVTSDDRRPQRVDRPGAGRRGVRRDRGRAAAGTPVRSPGGQRAGAWPDRRAARGVGRPRPRASRPTSPTRARSSPSRPSRCATARQGARTSRAARSTTSARATRSSRCGARPRRPRRRSGLPPAPRPFRAPSSAAPRKHRPAPPVRSSPTTGSASATAAATSTSWWPSARRRRPRCNGRRGRSSTASPWTPAWRRTGGRAGSGLQRAHGAPAAALLVLGEPVARPGLELGQRGLQLAAHRRERRRSP